MAEANGEGVKGPSPEELMFNYVKSNMIVTVRGMVACAPGVPPDFMLRLMCRSMGALVGELWGGLEEDVEKFRNQCRAEFSGEMHKTPITPIVQPAKPAEAA